MKRGRGYSPGSAPEKEDQNGLSIRGPSPSPFLPPVQCGVNRNWSLAKGRSTPARAAGSLAGGLSQEKKHTDCDLHGPTVDVGRGSEAFLTLPLPVLGLFSERWAVETELPP